MGFVSGDEVSIDAVNIDVGIVCVYGVCMSDGVDCVHIGSVDEVIGVVLVLVVFMLVWIVVLVWVMMVQVM